MSDITQSVIASLEVQFSGNKKAVEDYLKSLQQSAKAHEQEKAIKDLEASFPTLPKETVIKVLNANKWDIDSCFVPLFELIEQQRLKEIEERKAREDKKKREVAEKKAKELFVLFQQIPQETIMKLLKEHQDDVEETAGALCKLVEEKDKKRAQTIQKPLMEDVLDIQMRVLVEKFPEFSRDQLRAALAENKGELQPTVKALLNHVEEQKRKELKLVFPNVSFEEIEIALAKAKRDKMSAARILSEVKTVQPPAVELKDSKVLQPVIIPPKIQDDITQQSIIIASTAAKMQEEDDKIAQQIFREKLENDISNKAVGILANMHVVPGTKPPLLPIQIDELKKQQPSTLPAPVDSHIQTSVNDPKPASDIVVTMKAGPVQVDVGSSFSVEFEITGKSSSSDWIGIFPVAAANKEYLTYQWRGKDEQKGKLTFAAPSEYGEYEFRYFCNKNYSHIAASNKVKVGPEIKLEAKLSEDSKKLHAKWTQLTGNTVHTSSWVGLFKKQETNNKGYVEFNYANKVDLVFTTPTKPGEYELRFFTNSYVDVARSNTFRIEGEDKMKATYKDGHVYVELDLVSVDASDRPWIGLYFVKETSDRRFRRYQGVKENKGTMDFVSPKTEGTYEARLYRNGTYDLVMKSNTFEIPNGH